tara:strand:+ start:231 stop:608 length:378 start_codon:yes stop_codon:yes gene_type:complete
MYHYRSDISLFEKENKISVIGLFKLKKYTYHHKDQQTLILSVSWLKPYNKLKATYSIAPQQNNYVNFYEYFKEYKGNRYLIPNNYSYGFVESPVDLSPITYNQAEDMFNKMSDPIYDTKKNQRRS